MSSMFSDSAVEPTRQEVSSGSFASAESYRSPSDQQVADAYDLYRKRGDDPDGPEATAFRAQHSWETRVRFVGVWDTVGSLGIPVTGLKLPFFRDYYEFHDTELSKIVDYAYHALALDEFREDFAPTLWTKTKPENLAVEQRWFAMPTASTGPEAVSTPYP